LYKEAEPLLREAHSMAQSNHDAGTNTLTERLAQCLIGQGNFKEAEPLVKRAVNWFQNKYGLEDEDTLDCKCLQVECLYHNRKFSEAEVVARATIEGLKKNLHRGPDHAHTFRCTAFLALILKEERKTTEAIALAEANQEALDAEYKHAEKVEAMGSRRLSHAERFELDQAYKLTQEASSGPSSRIQSKEASGYKLTQEASSGQNSRVQSKEASDAPNVGQP
jgi:hypothetical protein